MSTFFDKIMNIKNRFQQIADFKGVSIRKLEQIFSLNRGNISSIPENGAIGSDKLSKIIDSMPELSIEWLITGKGSMIRGNEALSTETQDIIKGIPLITYDAIAGFSSMDNEGAAEEDFARYIVPEFINKGVEFLIRVSGSSMYPKYSSGDILACKFIKDRLFFQWGKIYVIDSSQGILVKRVRKHEKYPEYIMLESDNREKYQPFDFPTSDIRSLSIVVGVIRLE